jgi:hypothetical protein
MTADVLGVDTAKRLLREDCIGLPNITDAKWLTSANRAHHASHLAAYLRAKGRPLWEAGCVAEWGGGYGNMARLIRRMNPRCTYIIFDLPEILALQYVYLTAVEGEEPHLLSPTEQIAIGKVNLVASYAALAGEVVTPMCDAFISTWALSESPASAQTAVLDRRFFGASAVLMAYRRGDGNRLEAAVGGSDLAEFPVPFYDPSHSYALA